MLFIRKILNKLELFINTDDIVVIHGARQVGKTCLLKLIIEKYILKNYAYFDLEDLRFLELFENGHQRVVKYINQNFQINPNEKFFIIIDEIQYLSNPSSFLKILHDHYKQFKLIVSGSSSFDIKKNFSDSLVGRTVNFELFPLDFEEFLIFKKEKISIKEKIDEPILIEKLKDYFEEFIVYGGYPKIVLEDNIIRKEAYLQQIIDTYIKKDIRDIANIKNIMKFNNLLRLVSSYGSKLLNIAGLSKELGLSKQTVEEYLFILEATYILKLLPPFFRNLKKELTKRPKIFFYDTGIMNLLQYRQFPKIITGEMFETSIFAELIKNFSKNNLNYWRTQDKKEIDFILNFKNRLIPIEVKINSTQFSGTAMRYFKNKYKVKDNFIIVLNQSKDNFIHPWEIYFKFNDQINREYQ
jgi:predicted AAA+ superfamily ATPase